MLSGLVHNLLRIIRYLTLIMDRRIDVMGEMAWFGLSLKDAGIKLNTSVPMPK